MSNIVVGTCGNCGGDVVSVDGPWMCILPPPPPRCVRCGARVAQGPVLPMQTPPKAPTTKPILGHVDLPAYAPQVPFDADPPLTRWDPWHGT